MSYGVGRQQMKQTFVAKNLDALGVKPSVSLIFPLEFVNDSASAKWLTGLLNRLFIKELYFRGNILQAAFTNKIIQNSDLNNFDLFFQYQPDIRAYLADHPDQTCNLIKRNIFSTISYRWSIHSWDIALIRFFGRRPEVLDLSDLAGNKAISVNDAQNVQAVFALQVKNGKMVLTDISEQLNRKNGRLALPEKPKGIKQILIIRRYRLQIKDRISQRFNFYNLAHARMLQEIFSVKLKKKFKAYKGLFFDMELIFESLNQQSWPEYDHILENFSNQLLKNIAASWVNGRDAWKVAYEIARKDFFIHELRRDLSKMSTSLKHFIPSDHSLTQRMELNAAFILQIDARKFLPGTPYYRQSLMQIKRMATRRHLEGTPRAPVAIHHLFNRRFSFADKQKHLDQLIASGANHFYFTFLAESCQAKANVLNRLQADNAEFPYYSVWLNRLHQLGHFLQKSVPRCEILALYPLFDTYQDDFLQALQTLEERHLNYALIDLDLFSNDKQCTVNGNRIACNGQTFRVIVLPAVSVLPVATLEKLAKFVEKGGTVLALKNLPRFSLETKKQRTFDNLKKEIWFEGNEPLATSFKKHDSGGRGFYQKDLGRMDSLLEELQPFLKFKIKTSAGAVRFTFQEAEEACYLFIVNTQPQNNVVKIHSPYIGRPYYWNFTEAESVPCPFWYTDPRGLHLKITLMPSESRLLLISKTRSASVRQLYSAELDGVKIMHQGETLFEAEGWRRKEGFAELTVKQDSSLTTVKEKIPDKIPILRISSKNWHLKSKNYEGKAYLGDHSKLYPFGNGSVIYHKIIILERKYTKSYRLFLDLGKVMDWCVLYWNDVFVARSFAPPYVFDISDFVRSGENKLSIGVFYTQANRLAQNCDIFPLREYGLFGPVKIIPYGRIHIKI